VNGTAFKGAATVPAAKKEEKKAVAKDAKPAASAASTAKK